MITFNYKSTCLALIFLSISFISFGQVGIGTATPQSTLDVEGSLSVGTGYSGTRVAPTNGAIIEGNLGVGTHLASKKLHVDAGTENLPVLFESNSSRMGMILQNNALSGTNNSVEIRFRNNDGSSVQDAGHIQITDNNFSATANEGPHTNHFAFTNRRAGGFGWYSNNSLTTEGTLNMLLDSNSNLDVHGGLRVRSTDISSSTNDIPLVMDSQGNVKQQLNSREGNFRGRLRSNYDSGSSSNIPNSNGIYEINTISEILDSGDDFNDSTDSFTAPITGLYEVTITLTIKGYSTSTGNFVTGLLDSSNSWVMRFSMQKEEFIDSSPSTGVARTYTGIAQFTAGQSYNFGFTSGDFVLLSNPSGSTGTGLGSYFKIQLLNN